MDELNSGSVYVGTREGLLLMSATQKLGIGQRRHRYTGVKQKRLRVALVCGAAALVIASCGSEDTGQATEPPLSGAMATLNTDASIATSMVTAPTTTARSAAAPSTEAPGSAPLGGTALIYQWDGADLGSMSPIKVEPGASIPVRFNGFNSGSTVEIEFSPDRIDGGTFIADSGGEVAGTITIPTELTPSVHRVVFEGTNGNSPRSIEVLIEIDGRPVGGDTYATYFEGFVAFEDVAVIYGGLEWFTSEANQDGGIVVDVPMVNPIGPATVRIEATGLTSGTTGTVDVIPVPSSSALWATSDVFDAIRVSGSPTIDGAVHSEGGIKASGSGSFDNGAELVGDLDVSGSVEIDPVVQVEAGAVAPVPVELAATVAGLVATVEIAASECSGGRWEPDSDDLVSGVVYVPCDVELKGSRLDGPIGATIIADGEIKISGSGVEFAVSESLSLVALGVDGAIRVSGSRHILGPMFATESIRISGSRHTLTGEAVTLGEFRLSGGNSNIQCGVYASTILLSGGNSTFSACPNPPD